MRSLELFAGCGGLALGVEQAGFEHVGVVEIDANAAASLRYNTSWPVHEVDVRTLDYGQFEEVMLVSGGPPCQPFSVGGRHSGPRDARDMFPEATRAVDELRPLAFLFENVAGLVRPRFCEYLGEVIDALSRAGPGYRVSYMAANAADYGVPQVRRRVFIVGFRVDTDFSWEPPAATHSKSEWVTIAQALADLPDPEYFPRTGISGHVFQPNARVYPGHTGSPLDKPAKTLKAGVHGVPGGENMLRRPDGTVRYFSVREAARLQTFPDQWQFSGAWTEAMRQIGNAVPVQLAAAIAQSVAAPIRTHAKL